MQNVQGATNVLACGTTGEFASLSLEEREAVTECCAETFKGTVISTSLPLFLPPWSLALFSSYCLSAHYVSA